MGSLRNLLNQFIKNERIRSFVFWFSSWVVIDQVLKLVLFAKRYPQAYFHFGNDRVLGFQQFENLQFAFSLPLPLPIIYLIYFIALAFLIYYFCKNFNLLNQFQLIAWTAILAGALSNVFERVIRGSVRDYFFVYGGGILNFADLCILGGVIAFFILEYRTKKL